MASGFLTVKQATKRTVWAAGTVSGILYSGWALAGNWSYGFAPAVGSALAQFIFSFVATSIFSGIISYLIGSRQGRLAALGCGLAAAAVYSGLLLAVHLAIGTPALFMTTAPVICIATAYALWFSHRVAKHNRNDTVAG